MSALYRLVHRTCDDVVYALTVLAGLVAASQQLRRNYRPVSGRYFVPGESQWLEEGRSASLIGVHARTAWTGRMLRLEFRRIRGQVSTGETMMMALERRLWCGGTGELTMQPPSPE